MVVEYPTDSCGGGLAMVEGGNFRFHTITKLPLNRLFKKTQEASAVLAKRKTRATADLGNSYSKGKPFNHAGNFNPPKDYPQVPITKREDNKNGDRNSTIYVKL